jgi:hypothetical protein
MAKKKVATEPKLLLQSKTVWLAFVIEAFNVIQLNLNVLEPGMNAEVFKYVSLLLPVAMIYLRMVSTGPIVVKKQVQE